MNTLVIVLIAAVCLIAGYTFYGSWLAKKWGIDPKAKTPAVAKNDGQDYVPTDGWTVFAHQFSSIAGAGPVTGAIQAAVFGWVPVLLWILIGGIGLGDVSEKLIWYPSGTRSGLLFPQEAKAPTRRLMATNDTILLIFRLITYRFLLKKSVSLTTACSTYSGTK